ncbi:hypothetical protein Ahy_B05g078286 [Arachis hypogaea]|uniref:NAF domain-containing protein n=1 Tax=Arachis hypogaea TaxID=3818 RepID=A0A444Z6T7_ARAHY|nr:hypothetical protein Ahy_B05g078286 [Arachis hypogaea]
MEMDFDQHGPAFRKHGQTSQSFSLSDIFTLNDGSVTPLLKIEAEASSVQAIARTLCPLKIILDRENQVTKRKEKSVSMNAFELISRSQSFNLDSFFEQQTCSEYIGSSR